MQNNIAGSVIHTYFYSLFHKLNPNLLKELSSFLRDISHSNDEFSGFSIENIPDYSDVEVVDIYLESLGFLSHAPRHEDSPIVIVTWCLDNYADKYNHKLKVFKWDEYIDGI
jgi:adenosine deaminase